jgi:hypothetical protein
MKGSAFGATLLRDVSYFTLPLTGEDFTGSVSDSFIGWQA